jgi:predicted transcriptional regulator
MLIQREPKILLHIKLRKEIGDKVVQMAREDNRSPQSMAALIIQRAISRRLKQKTAAA